MAGFALQSTGILSSIFVGVYAIYLMFAIWLIHLRGFKTIFTFLFVFAIIRLGGQISGIVFSLEGYNDSGAFIAYLVLTAQGFIALLFATLRATMYEQKCVFGHSWFFDSPFWNEKFKTLRYFTCPYAILAWLLMAGSAISIAVGVEQSESDSSMSNYDYLQHLRIAALAIYLSVTVALIVFSWYVFLIERVHTRPLVFILLSEIFLLVRVIYNLLTFVKLELSEFTYSVAEGVNINPHFIIYEAILGFTMEFICCILLTCAFVYSHSPTRNCQESQIDVEKASSILKAQD